MTDQTSEAAAVEAAEVARARAGDEEAFEALVRRREAEVYRLCARVLGDRTEALDATQDTFLRVFRGLPSFRGEATFRTWVLGIAINVCRTRMASRKRRERHRWLRLTQENAASGEEVTLEIEDRAPGPEARARASELRHALERALASLRPEHRELILLHQMTGLEYEALARVLGVRLGTVKSRMARARAALRAALREVWP